MREVKSGLLTLCDFAGLELLPGLVLIMSEWVSENRQAASWIASASLPYLGCLAYLTDGGCDDR